VVPLLPESDSVTDDVDGMSFGIGGKGGRGHIGRLMTMDGVRRRDNPVPGEEDDFVCGVAIAERDGRLGKDMVAGG